MGNHEKVKLLIKQRFEHSKTDREKTAALYLGNIMGVKFTEKEVIDTMQIRNPAILNNNSNSFTQFKKHFGLEKSK